MGLSFGCTALDLKGRHSREIHVLGYNYNYLSAPYSLTFVYPERDFEPNEEEEEEEEDSIGDKPKSVAKPKSVKIPDSQLVPQVQVSNFCAAVLSVQT